MRHRSGLRKLNRTSAHRLSMLRNMVNSLLRHEAIKTTLPKAKELRRAVEPMITLGKNPSVANRRLAFNRLRDREMVTKLFDVLGPRFAKRNGGYTRVLKMGFRSGDNAPMAYVELTEKAVKVEEVKETKKAPAKKAAATKVAEEKAPDAVEAKPKRTRRASAKTAATGETKTKRAPAKRAIKKAATEEAAVEKAE